MDYRVEISAEAASQLAKLPDRIRRQIDAKIQALRHNPRPSGVVFLKGGLKGLCRIRSGDYRIVYQIRDKELLIIVVLIGNRRDVYE